MSKNFFNSTEFKAILVLGFIIFFLGLLLIDYSEGRKERLLEEGWSYEK